MNDSASRGPVRMLAAAAAAAGDGGSGGSGGGGFSQKGAPAIHVVLRVPKAKEAEAGPYTVSPPLPFELVREPTGTLGRESETRVSVYEEAIDWLPPCCPPSTGTRAVSLESIAASQLS
jgi:hypothetical protein